MPLELLMGVDIGTTNTRCVLYSPNAEPVAVSMCGSQEALAEDGSVDGDLLFAAVLRVCREVLEKPEKPFHLHGIAVACVGTRHILVDKDNRQIRLHPRRDAVMDTFNKFMENRDSADYFNTTGYPPIPDFPGFLLSAAARNGESKSVDAMLSVADYVNLRLTGIRSREYSTACSMALWNHKADDWWDDILRFAEIDRRVLGSPTDSAKPIGPVLSSICAAAGIPEGTMVYTGGHDFLCASVAGNCRNDFLNMCGTYDLIVSFQDKPFQKSPGDLTHCYADRHMIPGRFSLQYESAGAGQTELLRKHFFRASNAEWDVCFAKMNASAYIAPGKTLFIPNAKGEFFRSDKTFVKTVGLRGGASRPVLLSAMIESLSYKARRMLERQQKALGTNAARLMMLGGGSRSSRWAQIRANIFGIPVIVPRVLEATALGAALMAGIGASVYTGFEDAMRQAALRGTTVYEPDLKMTEQYAEIYKTYLKEYGMEYAEYGRP
ncbi:MAG: FGGY-family carbohydrate kinase [Oscillospiraceae bacterium]|nr:FGGY-family carbohydrate kinase [Oscillospiraceae bacterium]